MLRDVTVPPCSWRYKYRNLALQVGRVSYEIAKLVMDPAQLRSLSDCTENYRPILSSERAPYMKKKESNCQT
jgi:hypothetical protein